MSKKQILQRLYTKINSSTGLSTPHRLWEKAKHHGITLKECILFLRDKPSYTLHRLQRVNFPRRKVVVPYPKHTICVDLADLSDLSEHNDGIRYAFVLCDGFSRWCEIRTQKNKTGPETARSLKDCLKLDHFRGLKKCWSDNGAEFKSAPFQKTLQSHNIIHYTTYNYDIKVSLVERLIQTIKRKIYRYLTEKNTFRYIDVLQDIVKSYNVSQHRSLAQDPYTVHFKYDQNQIAELFEKMHEYKSPPRTKSLDIKPGSLVRVSTLARIDKFSKKARRVASREIFKVVEVDLSQYPPLYLIQDHNGDKIEGRFYAHELVLTQ